MSLDDGAYLAVLPKNGWPECDSNGSALVSEKSHIKISTQDAVKAVLAYHKMLSRKYFCPMYTEQYGKASREEEEKYWALTDAAVEALKEDLHPDEFVIEEIAPPHPNPFES
ncbi:MAG: hypothetical protein AAF542_07295 [Pseudomonadota bacterium]